MEIKKLMNIEIFSEIDQIILHLSRDNNIKKFIFKISGTDSYLVPSSFFSLQGLEHLELSYCTFELPIMNRLRNLLGPWPHKLPISLPHLRILVLGVCFDDLSTVLCVICSCPNLEKIKAEMCWEAVLSKNFQ
ncbi:unnamed protein product [Lactuca saligna]|uniref:Leucine-rich repeat domain, L domain-containing protein n=1 Tax=Lactuca saligna TaxID=75948 RepID=A0AA35VH05_LACSI|nr:unnamed protein product [Lactuca saligna]